MKKLRRNPFGKRGRLAKCRDCGLEQIVDTCDFMRASIPRCSSCGGVLEKKMLLTYAQSHGIKLKLPPKPHKTRCAHKIRHDIEATCCVCGERRVMVHTGPLATFKLRCSCGNPYSVRERTKEDRRHDATLEHEMSVESTARDMGLTYSI